MIIEKQILGSVAYFGHGAIREEFMWSWGSLIQYTNEFCLHHPRELVHWVRGNQSGQILARNHVAATMLGDWLLMLDTDHTFEPDLLHRMLKVFNGGDMDVLSGVYVYKTPPYHPVVYNYSQKRDGYSHMLHLKEYAANPHKAYECDAAGAGTLLIRRRVFERIAKEMGQGPFSPFGKYETDDFSFFERLRALGIKSWVCPAIQTYHLRVAETGLDDYDSSSIIELESERRSIPTIAV